MEQEFSHFAGKVCVVTGAASGIGRALAITLIRSGAYVAISDIDGDALTQTLTLADATTLNHVCAHRLDVSDAVAIEAYATMIAQSLGNVDYLFNIAGLTRLGSFEETALEAHEQVINVNYWGVVRMCKAFLPSLIEQQGGIINISSLFGLIGFPGQAHYCASKFAVRGFSESLAQELADKNVSVSCVHPGGVDTGIVRNAISDGRGDGRDREKINRSFKKAARTSPEQAVKTILRAVEKRKQRIIIGNDAKILSFAQRMFPHSYKALVTRINMMGTKD